MDKRITEKSKPKVSIVVPMYMCERYVAYVLESLCAQDMKDIEIICVIDGSPDATLKIAEECAYKDSRISVLYREHGGAGVARNLGLDNINGEYVMFLDSDDVFQVSFVRKMYQAISASEADIALCRYIRMDSFGGTGIRNAGFSDTLVNSNNIIEPERVPDVICDVSSVVHNRIYRKSFLDDCKIRFSSTTSLNDVFFANATLISAKRVALLDERLYTYRVNHNVYSITSNRESCKGDVITVFKELYAWLRDNGKFEYYRESFFKKWRSMFSDYCRYGVGEGFQDEVVNYLSTCEPWSLMDGKTLYRKAGLYSGAAKVRKNVCSNKLKAGEKRGEDTKVHARLVKQFESEVKNKSRIREKLQAVYGKNVNKSDSIIREGIFTVRDMGVVRTALRFMSEVSNNNRGV